MSKNKYYYPDHEEFRIGFEYQTHADPRHDDGWLDHKIENINDLWRFCGYQRKDPDVDIRVKRLSREDILSLDFNYEGTSSTSHFYHRKLNNKETIEILENIHKNNYSIYLHHNQERDTIQYYFGDIKNKLELIELLNFIYTNHTIDNE